MAARRPELVAGAVAGLVLAALFFSAGSSSDRVFWLGGGALVLAGVLCALALSGTLPLPRLDRAGIIFLVALASLVAWTGASLAWSIVPDRSWLEFDRGIAYLAFGVVGVLLGAALPRAPSRVAAGFTVLLAAVLGWALLGKIFPALYAAPIGSPVTRLRNPVGYWNVLALLGDAALPLALWIAALRGRRQALRVAGVLVFYVAVVAVLLTYSRTGLVVGGLVIVAWLVLTPGRLESLAATAFAAAPAVAVAIFAATRTGLERFEPHSTRVRDGAWFGLVLTAGAVVAGGLALGALRWEAGRSLTDERRRLLERRVAATLAAGVVLVLVGLAFHAGGPSAWWRDFTNPAQVGQGSGRLTSGSSNNRWEWWKEAWRVFEQEPVLGKGASSFAVARRPIRHTAVDVTEPHSTPLQFLSELGIVGFLLGAAAAVAAFWTAVGAVRRVGADERLPAVALGLGLGAYGLHALVDYDWEFLGATGPALIIVGALAAAGRPALAPGRRWAPTGLVVVTVLAALYSLGAPWLASRRVDQSYAALDRGDVAAAVSKAASAHRLNPLSYEPWWALAGAAIAAGDQPAATGYYGKAAILQPENPETWYTLGQYEFDTGDYANACYALDLAYRLDPRGPAGDPGGLLDRVKKRLPGCPASTK